ncbi:hypothetical protein EIMP300_72880 [Escherichia coli]|uniref:Uncharacterized protein n=1 Tax=Escherichia coli TaxID=562 RepID=A0A8S0G1P9_ECOLX|nr:hypothetical protein EIMP300_72880 [Escherichia coli]
MGYLNNVTGYRDDLLANRAIVKHGNFALLTPDGLVKNIIPGFVNCDATILSTPKLGASFVDYLVTLHQNGDIFLATNRASVAKALKRSCM